MVARPALVLAGVLALFSLWPDLRHPEYAMAVQILASVLVAGLAMIGLRRSLPKDALRIKPEFHTAHWLRRALPFTLIGGTVIINNQADIIILGWFREASEVGVYRVAVQGGVLTTFVLQGASAVTGPHFSRLHTQGRLQDMGLLLKRTARIVLVVTAPVALIFIFWGGEFAGFVFGDDFYDARFALAILAAGYLVNVAFGPVGQLLQMTGYEKATAKALGLTAGLNVVLNLALIPAYGMIGAASTTALSVALYHGILRGIIRKEFRF
jgi:O-antigen/teichoic acid export membrane protein